MFIRLEEGKIAEKKTKINIIYIIKEGHNWWWLWKYGLKKLNIYIADNFF